MRRLAAAGTVAVAEPVAEPVAVPGSEPVAVPGSEPVAVAVTGAESVAVAASEPGLRWRPAREHPPGSEDRDVDGPVVVVRGSRTLRVSGSGVLRLRLGPLNEEAWGTLGVAVRGRTLARRALHLPEGRPIVVRLRLSHRGRVMLARRGAVAARMTISLRDAAGNRTVGTFAVTLRAAR